MNAPLRPSRRHAGRTLVEVLMALGVFSLGSLGMWECIRMTFFLAAKNTGLNLSHSSLQFAMDQMANQVRSSMLVVDVATFDGTTFTHVDDSVGSAAGNAVRFLRVLPVSLFVLPDKAASPWDINNPQDPYAATYPDTLTPGNTAVKVRVNALAPSFQSGFQPTEWALDLKHARLLPRFPYLTEIVTGGSNPGTKPGLGLAAVPNLASTSPPNPQSLTLASGLPTTSGVVVPSCNQAYLVVESAFAVLNRGTYAELIYYPDPYNLARKNSLTTGLGVSSTGSGPNVFTVPKPLGLANDTSTRATLQITLPVFQPNLANTVVRRGGTAAMMNIELTSTVEVRRRVSY